MLEIQTAVLFTPGFLQTVQKLSKAHGIPSKTAYRLGKITKAIMNEFTKAESKRIEILKAHAEKTESGEFKKNEAGEIVFANKDAMKSEIEAMLAKAFTIEQLPVQIDHLDAAQLSPEEIVELDFMLLKD